MQISRTRRPVAKGSLGVTASALLLATALGTGSIFVPTTAFAQSTQSYDIPAGPLATALNRFIETSGVALVYDSALTSGLSSPGLKGSFSTTEALSHLLAGSGLTFRQRGANEFTLERAPSVADGAVQLGPVRVEGAQSAGRGPAIPSTGVLGTTPDVHAGRQVARGARLGILGNRDIMDMPFSSTAYTAELVENQQARNIIDVLANDPSAQGGGPWHFDNFYIRGFAINREEIGFDGLYGIASAEGSLLEGIERVEVLKGPNTLVNGAAPKGTAGGAINLVPKRAGDTPLTRFNLNYVGDSNVGGHADIGRRFGTDGAFGVRINAAYRGGEVSTDREHQDVGVVTLGFDYRDERLRLSADLGYDMQDLGAPKSNFFVASPVLPRAPRGHINVWPSWTYQDKEHVFAVARAEFDATPDLTFGLAYGGAESKRQMLEAFGVLANEVGGIDFFGSGLKSKTKTRSGEATARLQAVTGGLAHQFVLSATQFTSDITNLQPSFAYSATSNLYTPAELTAPTGVDFDQPLVRLSETKLRGVALADTISALDDRLLLTLGVRHQRISVDAFNYATGAFETHYGKSATTPAVAVVFKPTGQVSLYANYVEALSQGDRAPSTAVNASEVFAPYVSKQGEVGVKVDWGTITTTLSAFQITRPSGFLDAGNRYSVDGEQRNRGLELQVFGELADRLRVLGGIAWTKAELTETRNGTYDGNQAAGTPEWSIKLGGEWDIAAVPGLTATARVQHSSSQAFTADNSVRLPSWTRLDLGGRYATAIGGTPVTFRATVENVTDARYWDTAPSYQVVTYAAPRTVLLSASFDF